MYRATLLSANTCIELHLEYSLMFERIGPFQSIKCSPTDLMYGSWYIYVKGLINQQRQLGGSIRRSSATKKLCTSAPKAMALTRSFLGMGHPRVIPHSQKGTPPRGHGDPHWPTIPLFPLRWPEKDGFLQQLHHQFPLLGFGWCNRYRGQRGHRVRALDLAASAAIAEAKNGWGSTAPRLGGPPFCANDMTSIDLYLLCYIILTPTIYETI